MTLAYAPVSVIYTGNGTTSAFNIASGSTPIHFRSNSHIKAVEVDTDGNQTVVVQGTHYNISGGPDNGVLTRIAGALPSGYKLAIWREQPLAQETSWSNGGRFSSSSVESTLDRVMEMLQEVDYKASRAIRVPEFIASPPDLEVLNGETVVPIVSLAGGLTGLDRNDLGSGTGDGTDTTPYTDDLLLADNAGEARDILELGDLATQDDVTTAQMLGGHGAIDHSSIIAAYNQTNSATVLMDVGQWVVESATTTTPPSVTNGHAYLIPIGASGAWATNVGRIAYGVGGVWTYKVAAKGWSAYAKDTDLLYVYDGTAWSVAGGATTTSPSSYPTDGRVAGYAKTNGHGGARWRAHWTADNRIVVLGDTATLTHDASGDNWGPYEIPWDADTNGNITNLYAGTNYLLIQTDKATANLWGFGNNSHGQLGQGSTTASSTPVQVGGLSSVKVAAVYTEANVGGAEYFWFAVTTTGTLYGCGYSGATHTQGYNSTTNVTTPRQVTFSSSTALTGVSSVSCCSAHTPVWVRFTNGTACRWGAGTSGAHGNNSTSALTWPTMLETTVGSGTNLTGVSQIVTTGYSAEAASAYLLTSGAVYAAGSRAYGIGDGAAIGSANQTTFVQWSGAIAGKTVTQIFAGGGDYIVFGALDNEGNWWQCGYNGYGIHANGGSTAVSTLFKPTLPAGFATAVTGGRIAGGGGYQVVYVEATISGKKRVASAGYQGYSAGGKRSLNTTAASETFGVVEGIKGTVSSWQSVGDSQLFGIEVLQATGELRYAGANDQGQAGTQPGNLHSVMTLQKTASPGVLGGLSSGQFLELPIIPTPSTPATGYARVFAYNNGGVAGLAVEDPTGAVATMSGTTTATNLFYHSACGGI